MWICLLSVWYRDRRSEEKRRRGSVFHLFRYSSPFFFPVYAFGEAFSFSPHDKRGKMEGGRKGRKEGYLQVYKRERDWLLLLLLLVLLLFHLRSIGIGGVYVSGGGG